MAVWLSRNEGNEGNGGGWNGMEWETKKKIKKIEMMGFKSSWSSLTNQAFFALRWRSQRMVYERIQMGFLDFWIFFSRCARAVCVRFGVVFTRLRD
jgi:hypothetical protein